MRVEYYLQKRENNMDNKPTNPNDNKNGNNNNRRNSLLPLIAIVLALTVGIQ